MSAAAASYQGDSLTPISLLPSTGLGATVLLLFTQIMSNISSLVFPSITVVLFYSIILYTSFYQIEDVLLLRNSQFSTKYRQYFLVLVRRFSE